MTGRMNRTDRIRVPGKRIRAILAAILVLIPGVLSGCGKSPAGDEAAAVEITVAATEETVPPTIPADGNPKDVTCKGSYTAEKINGDAVVATVGDAVLTNSQLQVCYWMEVAAYRQAQNDIAPDFDRPLDSQACEIDQSVASWQQYFLKRALNAWCGSQALMLQGEEEGLPTEEAYQPNLDNYEKYMTGMPATKFLYGYSESYQPNTMHQEYLDNIPAMLEELAKEKGYADASAMAKEAFDASSEDLTAYAELYNRGYMYFTSLGYSIETTAEETEAFFAENKTVYEEMGITKNSGKYVDIRHILLVPDEIVQEEESKNPSNAAKETTEAAEPVVLEPVSVAEDGTVTCSEAVWQACKEKADALLESWQSDRKASDATFAELANKNSDDPGSAINGGAYRRLRKGQMMPELDAWCFGSSRQPGDTTIIRSEYGYHILYFTGSTDIWYAEAQKDLTAERQAELIAKAVEKYPAEVDYAAITLSQADGTVSVGDVLYPDVAHERFPEVPLYLQQDYPTTMYGGYPIRTNGCGITTMAMLASYLADEEWTPPEMCAMYGRYSFSNGTDGMIFVNEPPVLGFYLKEKTYDPKAAKAALEEGHIVVSIQHKGYWTRGGHYIILEEIAEDGRIQVRDSNIYNYNRVPAHVEDLHTWGSITGAGSGYWIFEYKITNIPACSRCGEPEGVTESLLAEDYTCEKCSPAMLRRETYLTACGS